MATRTKPLVTAAALVSAAAVLSASPVMAPSISAPTTTALSQAAYELTTFSDVLSIPSYVWTDVLFGVQSWGGVLGPETYGPAWAAPQDGPQLGLSIGGYVNPWAYYCDNGCFAGQNNNNDTGDGGLSAVAYLFFDALVNGNGNGYDDSANWNIGLVNYLFEPSIVNTIGNYSLQEVSLGVSAAAWYLLQGTIGQAIPQLTQPIAALFWAEQNLNFVYADAWLAVAGVVANLPLVGFVAANSIYAYVLGNVIVSTNPEDVFVYASDGLSAVLNYWVDLVTGTLLPYDPSPPAAATAAVAATATATAAAEAADVAVEATPASTQSAESEEISPASVAQESISAESSPVEVTGVTEATAQLEATEPTTEVDVTDAAPATESQPVDSTPVAGSEPASSTAVVSTPVAGSEPASSTEAESAPAAGTASVAPAKAGKRPVRGAAERVAKKIGSALSGAKAGASGNRSSAGGGGAADRSS